MLRRSTRRPSPLNLGNPACIHLLGEAYLHAGKLEECRSGISPRPRSLIREMNWLGLAWQTFNWPKAKRQRPLPRWATVWQISPEFLKLHPELPSIELTTESAQACISRLLDQPEGPAKHFLLAALYASTNESALAERELQSFQSDFSKWQQTSRCCFRKPLIRIPARLHLYSRCIASLQTAKPLTGAAHLLLGKTYFTLQQYERAADALAQVHGDTNANAEASYWLERTYQALGAESYAQTRRFFSRLLANSPAACRRLRPSPGS